MPAPVKEGEVKDGIDEKLAAAMGAQDALRNQPGDLGNDPPADDPPAVAPPADDPPAEPPADDPPADPPAKEEPGVPAAVQRRIDEVVAERYEERRLREAAERELAALRAAPVKTGPKTIEDYTEEELLYIIEQKPEFAPQAQTELATRRAVVRVERKLQAERQQAETQQRKVILSQEWQTLTERHPDLANAQSELYQLANKHFATMDQGRPGAMRAAVALAKEDLAEKQSGALQREKARLDKARVKGAVTAAAPGGRPPQRSTAPDLKKLEQAALASGNDMGHPAWLAYLKATGPNKEE